MAELRLAFDRLADFVPGFVKATEPAQRFAQVAPREAFFRGIASQNIYVRCLAVKGCGFLRAILGIVIQISQLTERACLPGNIAEPHRDRERFPVGILRCFGLARGLVRHAGLMPGHGDAARFVQLRESRARIGVSRKRL